MLETLLGSKSISMTLLFLFVNSKCYGTQMHRNLHTPLTPIQKALTRLEKAGVISSYYEGKTRLYHFNPAYPLLGELEQLLKKAYTLLTPQERQRYFVIGEDPLSKRSGREKKGQTVAILWERLALVKHLTFHSKSKAKSGSGWNGNGKGTVVVTRESDNRIIFTEKGGWQNNQGERVSFSNVFRWTLNREKGLISLEHLRMGPDQPVFLFHLIPSGNRSLSSIDSHLCEGDTYFGQIFFDQHVLRLNWRVIGPKKNEEIDYFYS